MFFGIMTFDPKAFIHFRNSQELLLKDLQSGTKIIKVEVLASGIEVGLFFSQDNWTSKHLGH